MQKTNLPVSLMKSDKMAEVKALVTEPIPNKVELLTFRPLSLSATPNPFVHVSLPLTTARVSPVTVSYTHLTLPTSVYV